MFKYDDFPILKLEVYNHEGILHKKIFRYKQAQPHYECSAYLQVNVIDFDTSEHLTLKKIFKTKNLSKQSTLAQLQNQSALKGNQNFIEIRQIFQDNQNIYLLQQQKPQSLAQILSKRHFLHQKQAQYIFCQLVSILESLRRNNIFHGGISLSTLFLDSSTMKLKLSGFGQSLNIAQIKQAPHTNLHSIGEPTPYTAPELLENVIDTPVVYYSADIWAVGAVLYTLLVGVEPFTHVGHPESACNKVRIPSAIMIKNYEYQFPQARLETEGCRQQTLGAVWKELLKRVFVGAGRRIGLVQLIEHPLNQITESRFTLYEGLNVPAIWSHNICSQDQLLSALRFITDSKQAHNGSNMNSNVSCKKVYSVQPCESLNFGQVNTQILNLILQSSKPGPIPLKLAQPLYLQKYCYLQQKNCLGYIFQNSIGVIFSDGSCVIGQNQHNYTYISNQVGNMDIVLQKYCKIYDKYYRPSRQTINPANNTTPNQKPQAYNKIGSKLLLNPYEKPTAKHIPDNSNLRTNISQPRKQSSSDIRMRQSVLDAKNLLTSNSQQLLPEGKQKVYEYFVRYFGERVVPSRQRVWVIGFWRLTAGMVFLYSNGTWQVNLSQGVNKRENQMDGDSTNPSTTANDLKKGKQAAILIDKYELSWFLQPVPPPTPTAPIFDRRLGFNFASILPQPSLKPKPGLTALHRTPTQFNPTCVKIARHAIRCIRGAYVRQFQEIMEPYQYSHQGSGIQEPA